MTSSQQTQLIFESK